MTIPSVKVRGMQKVLRKIDRAVKRQEDVVSGNIHRAGFHLFREAQKVVPIDTGNLAGSGSVQRDPLDEDRVRVGYDAAYAFAVHERENAKFKRPSAIRKWLEVTLNEQKAAILRIATLGR